MCNSLISESDFGPFFPLNRWILPYCHLLFTILFFAWTRLLRMYDNIGQAPRQSTVASSHHPTPLAHLLVMGDY